MGLREEETVLENPFKMKVPRELRTKLDDFKRECQEISEDFWTELDPDLGKINRDYHEIQNIIHDKGKNMYDTVYNARDAVDIARFMHFHWNGETELSLADHLFVYRPCFTHHGLYVGEEQVIHYAGGKVRYDNFEEFTRGCKICVLPSTPNQSPLRYPKEEVIQRAKSRLGEKKYNLITNNCEHFVRWCRAGREP